MKEKISKWFRKENFIVMILVGVLLFVIALPVKNSEESGGGKDNSSAGSNTTLSQSLAEEASGNAGSADEEYALYLEKRLKEVLSRMADVGAVEVMITLEASRELVVEKEQPVIRANTNEEDSQGGSRVVSEVETGENTVYRTSGSASEPYVIKTLSPEIEGVLVVAQGAGNGTVSRTIVEIVQALFGVDAHKVKVVKMDGAGEGE